MLYTLIRRAVLVAAVIVAIPVGAWAQTRTEAELLAQINKTPGDVANYLDLAKIYVEQKRYDDAQRMLINAATQIGQLRSSRTLLGGSMPVHVPGPTPPRVTTTSHPIPVGQGVTEPKKIRDVKPVYPPIAQTAQISGIVVAEIVVDTNGNVRDAKVLRGAPMLNDAALEAIRQWQYTPTLLNGVPVELVMTVTVNFSLGNEPAATGRAPVRVGGDIREPRRITHVPPEYPADAQAAKVAGIVILEVIIGVDGRVASAKVLRGMPMLNQAAIDAAMQWVYEPTYLQGVPVQVVMTTTVNFTLK